jgi:hypothetical protein
VNSLVEQEIYQRNLGEIRARGFGILLTWRDLGTLGADEPGWARVVLVGEEYNTFLLEIYPRSIAPFEDPETYIADLVPPEASLEYRQQVVERIRAEHEAALRSGRFVKLDTDHVGIKEIEQCIRARVPALFPELVGARLYLVDVAELEPWAEYWDEIEEAVQERYGVSLPDFLERKKPLLLEEDRTPVQVQGKPLSQLIIEERR